MIHKTPPSTIVKYCEPQFNLLNGCNTLLLGTLADFSENHEGKINDKTENLGWHVDENNNEFKRVPVISNCYIFCASLEPLPKEDVAKHLDAKYTSDYPIHDPGKFLFEVTRLLEDQFSLTDLKGKLPRTLTEYLSINELRQIYIDAWIAKVEYDDSKMEKKNWTGKSQKEMIEYYSKTKPTEFKEQKEIRFVFALYHPKFGYLDVKIDPILLNIETLTRTLDSPYGRNNIIRGNLNEGPEL